MKMVGDEVSIMTAVVVALFLAIAAAATLSHAAVSEPDLRSNQGVVLLETESGSGISTRIAEELARVVNYRAKQRLLPLIGTGSFRQMQR